MGAEGVNLSAGTFVSFLLYMTMFVQPVEIIGQMTRTVNRATSSAHRVFEILDTEPKVVDVPKARSARAGQWMGELRGRVLRVRRRHTGP